MRDLAQIRMAPRTFHRVLWPGEVRKHPPRFLEETADWIQILDTAASWPQGTQIERVAGRGSLARSNSKGELIFMSLKKLSAVVFAVLAISAVMASSAFAAAETKAGEWYTGASPGTTLAGSVTATATVGEHPVIGKKGQLNGTIAGQPVKITSTGISCVECKIENKEVTSKAGKVAFGTGKIQFTGVTADEPTGCTVSSEGNVVGEILTRKLVIHGDWAVAGSEKVFVQFIPEAGATAAFAQLKLKGGQCEAIEGPYNVTGTVFGESQNNRGVFAASQGIVFSPAIQTTTGAALKLGGNPAEFTGTGIFALTGGAQFAIK
jgi:hypothetical protein